MFSISLRAAVVLNLCIIARQVFFSVLLTRNQSSNYDAPFFSYVSCVMGCKAFALQP